MGELKNLRKKAKRKEIKCQFFGKNVQQPSGATIL
jgi:hypothetical protein